MLVDTPSFERLLRGDAAVDTPSFERLLRGDAAERYKYFMEATDLVSAKLIHMFQQCARCAHRVANVD
jgi:hypothetical protein